MDVRELVTRLGDRCEEMVKKAAQCETAKELLMIAEENDITLTDDEANLALSILHPHGQELSDAELDLVTGGEELKGLPQCCEQTMHLVTVQGWWEIWECWTCGATKRRFWAW